MWKPQPDWLIADWLGLTEPARGESCPSGQRRGPADPREYNISSPDQKYFHISTTPTAWGRKRRCPGSIPPRTVWNPQPHWLIADWQGLMEPARRESCPSGQRRAFTAPGEDKVSSPDQISFHISTTLTNQRDKYGDSTGRYRPTRCGSPNSGYTLLLIGVREASGPHPMRARSSARSLPVIEYSTMLYRSLFCC